MGTGYYSSGITSLLEQKLGGIGAGEGVEHDGHAIWVIEAFAFVTTSLSERFGDAAQNSPIG